MSTETLPPPAPTTPAEPPAATPPPADPALSPMTGGPMAHDPEAGITLHFPPPPPAAGEKDSHGREFDPVKFLPEKDSLGRWKNARAGRKPKNPGADDLPPADFSDVKKVLTSAQSQTLDGMADEIAAVKANPTAESIIGIIQTALMLIGEEEGLLSKTEKEMLRGPLVRVLAKYEIGDDALPPEADLVFAVLSIIAARLQKPKTATKWVMFKTWISQKFFAMKGRALAADIRREAAIPAAS